VDLLLRLFRPQFYRDMLLFYRGKPMSSTNGDSIQKGKKDVKANFFEVWDKHCPDFLRRFGAWVSSIFPSVTQWAEAHRSTFAVFGKASLLALVGYKVLQQISNWYKVSVTFVMSVQLFKLTDGNYRLTTIVTARALSSPCSGYLLDLWSDIFLHLVTSCDIL